MKKIIVSFLVSLVCFFGYAQTPYPTPNNPFGSKGTMTQAQGGWKIDSTAIMPVYVDTFAANRSKTSLYPGSLIRVGDDYYYRSADTSKWLLLAITTSNCAGTQLISGSITWSGSGLVYDATDLDYYILCTRYFANSTTLTLATADPTFPRIDKFYADITGVIGVITGVPSDNPQEPQVNPLTQIDMGFVYINRGASTPSGTTQTVIYNENVEWTGTSDVPSVNFAYATNPYIGSVSTYLPNAPNSSYVEWQSNGTDYLFSDAQYLKFWVRLNDNFVSDPISFLDVTFEYTDVTVSQTLAVGNGDYNMDYDLINQWQLVSIPLTGITTFGTDFNSVHFVINSAPTSFQLDYVYLLETATVPPAPVGGTWLLNGNSAINDVTQYIGTRDAKKLNIGTNGQIRAYIDTAGIELLLDDTTANVMLIDSNGKIWKTYQPTILADAPLYIYTDANNKKHIADTSSSSGGNCGLISGGEVTLIDTTTFNVSAALYCIGNVNYSSLDSVMTLATPGDTVRIDVIGVDTSGSVFKLTGVESVNPSPPSVDATYQLILSFVLVSTDSITPYNPQLSWSTGGNSGTNPFINFLGTTDDKGFMIKTNNNRSGYIDRIHFSSSWGIEALNTNAGDNNNAVGYGAGFLNSTGSDNNYLGNAAGYTNTTGSKNTAIGGISNYANTSGSENVAIGYRSLQNNQASGLVAVGFEALQLNTSGVYNTAVGYKSLNANTDGNKNTAIGESSLLSNIGGDDNVAISYLALRRNTTGSGNLGIGTLSLGGNETGDLNTAVGYNSGTDISSGSLNTIVGANAGTGLSSTDSSGAFGALAVAATRQMAFSPYFREFKMDGITGASNSGYVLTTDGSGIATFQAAGGGSSLFPTTGTGTATGNVEGALDGNTLSVTGGNVGIGTTTPDSLLTVNGNIKSLSLNTRSIYSDTGDLLVDLTDPFEVGAVIFPGSIQVPSIYSGTDDIVINIDHGILSAQPSWTSYNMGNVDWKNRLLKDSNTATQLGTQGLASVNWQDRQLVGTDGTTSILSWGANNVGIGTTSPDSLLDVQLGSHFKRGIRASGLPSNQTYSKSLGVTSNGTLYLKDTLAVSGVYATLNSPSLTTPTLGVATATSLEITGTAGAGFVKYLTQSSAPSTPASGFSLYADASNRFAWKGANGYVRTFDGTANTANRDYTLPDASGTIALTSSNITGSAATLTTPRLINGVSFNGSADISTDIFLKAYQALGSTIVAQNVDGQLPLAMTNLTMTSQRSYWSLVYLPVATTLTGVKWKQVTAGNYTANNYNGVGLYSISGGTLTLVASSTDDGNIWKTTSGTIGSKAFSSTYAAAAGAYMVVALHSSSANTTSPVIAALTGASGFVNQVWDFTNSAKSAGLISSLTALPSPTQAFSGITTSGAEVWFGLY